MSFKLFIDDERNPVTDDWVIARSSDQAIREVIKHKACPGEISFDHDLGGQDTSMRFVHWFVGAIMDGKIEIPHDFKFYIHSQNPVGAENIRCYMNAIIDNFKDDK